MSRFPSFLLIGDVANDEFRDIVPALAERGRVDVAPDVLAARRVLIEGYVPGVIVLACDRPGRFSEADVASLRRHVPLARLWTVLGSWCEGEMRTGRPWPGVVRIYWHQWRARLAWEMADGGAPTLLLPPTAAPEEPYLKLAEQPLKQRSGLVVICARDREAAAALSDACRLRGYATAVAVGEAGPPACGALAFLWDTTAEAAADSNMVKRLLERAAGAPILALLGFPRIDQVQSALQAGVAAVVSKPLLLEDLYAQLDRASQPRRATQ